MKTILVTGGAGFIGSYVVERLLSENYRVRVIDSLVEQVHHGAGRRYVPSEAEFIDGDVRDRQLLEHALHKTDAVIHLAAEVGVGQSMYEIVRYVDANTGGTAVLLELLAQATSTVQKVVVASSMSIYGEGSYRCPDDGPIRVRRRPEERLEQREWEPVCPECGKVAHPVPTAESMPLTPSSIYAISKMDQELMCLSVCDAYNIGAVALRFFNTYGPRQSLSNPYTGVGAIFSSRLLNDNSPLVFEDGNQRRDFIHVDDVARAVVAALESEKANGAAINVGTGSPVSVLDVANGLAHALDKQIEPEITGLYRVGDIRHCWPDVQLAEELLDFHAEVEFNAGLLNLVEWIAAESDAVDEGDLARQQLRERGLAR